MAENLEKKCNKMVPAVEKGVYACTCRGRYVCKGKDCCTGSLIEVPEGTKLYIPGWPEPNYVTKLPMCTKYSKINGNGSGK